MADTRLSGLAEITDPSSDDLLYVVDVSDTADSAEGSSRSVQVKNLPFTANSVVKFGAVGDGVTDDTAAFKAAIAAGGSIYVQPGTYKITETLNVKQRIRMYGPDGSQVAGYTAILQFADDIVGIFIHRSDTNAGTTGIPVIEAETTGADGSTLERLHIRRGNGSVPTGDDTSHGIWLKAKATIRDCRVSGFQGDGIYVRASTGGSDPLTFGNANNFYVARVRIDSCGGDGISAEGTDVNSGTGLHIDCTNNTEWGIRDDSFLGNTWLGCHAAGNDSGPYRTVNNAACSVFLGCYSEVGQPESEFADRTIVMGGVHGAGVIKYSGAIYGALYFDQSTIVPQLRSIGFTERSGSSSTFEYNLSKNTDTVWEVIADGDTRNGWNLRWNNTGKYWVHNHDLNNNHTYYVTTDLTTSETVGRGSSLDGGYILYPRGLWLGSGDTGRHLNSGSAAPTSGTFAQGDIVFNRAPSASGTVGWVCTTAGTPGTWKTFGTIAA